MALSQGTLRRWRFSDQAADLKRGSPGLTRDYIQAGRRGFAKQVRTVASSVPLTRRNRPRDASIRTESDPTEHMTGVPGGVDGAEGVSTAAPLVGSHARSVARRRCQFVACPGRRHLQCVYRCGTRTLQCGDAPSFVYRYAETTADGDACAHSSIHEPGVERQRRHARMRPSRIRHSSGDRNSCRRTAPTFGPRRKHTPARGRGRLRIRSTRTRPISAVSCASCGPCAEPYVRR